MTRDMPTIITGDDAEKEFGHLTLRDPDEMRRRTAEAFRNIDDIFAAQGLYLADLLQLMGKR